MCGCNKRRGLGAAPAVTREEKQVVRETKKERVVAKPAQKVVRETKKERVVAKPAQLTTSQWGPPVWTILHTLVELSEGKGAAVDPLWRGLLINLRGLLPCPECQRHYSDWWASVPIPTTGNFVGALRMWLLTLHNDVNRRNKARQWTETQVKAAYGGPVAERLAAVAAAQEKLRGLGLTALADGFRHVIGAVTA